MEARTFSGASLLVATPDSVAIEMLFGLQKTGGKPVGPDTWFDLASLTKPLVTASLCLLAVSDAMFALDTSIGQFLPAACCPSDKREITIGQLLGHCSGLPAYKPWYCDLIRLPPGRRSAALLAGILQTPLLSTPGRVSFYSDLGFLLLGMLLERVLGAPLDQLASRFLFRPHGQDQLGFMRLETSCDPTIPPENPDARGLEFAATEECPWRRRLLEGEVHDEHAFCLDGVAGHAGLFGTARGVLRVLSSLWQTYRGTGSGGPKQQQILKFFWTRQDQVRGGTWALGFDTPSSTGSSSGIHFSKSSVGHLGFTGTSFWLDMERDVLIILLTNRVHPTRDHERMKAFRPLVHNLVMEALNDLT